jgi:hypothetical protein
VTSDSNPAIVQMQMGKGAPGPSQHRRRRWQYQQWQQPLPLSPTCPGRQTGQGKLTRSSTACRSCPGYTAAQSVAFLCGRSALWRRLIMLARGAECVCGVAPSWLVGARCDRRRSDRSRWTDPCCKGHAESHTTIASWRKGGEATGLEPGPGTR